jgi:carbonic anhydrase/acetyltransferase-like protein (isoleucine patch superfamily)
VIEERVTIGHAAVVHNCWIGQNSLIGMRAVLLTDCRIGPESLVGAGSVVREGFEVPAHTLAIGNPAVNKGPLRGKAAKWVATAAEEYMQLLRSYR